MKNQLFDKDTILGQMENVKEKSDPDVQVLRHSSEPIEKKELSDSINISFVHRLVGAFASHVALCLKGKLRY